MLDFRRNPGYRYGGAWLNHVPTPADGLPDLAAVQAGESRRVACCIRGDHEVIPDKSRQGELVVSTNGTHWTPYWSLKRHAVSIPAPTGEITSRPMAKGDPGPFLRTRSGESRYAFISFPCAVGMIELGLPKADGPLVVFCLEAIRRSDTIDP
jgi:hypothetical protein